MENSKGKKGRQLMSSVYLKIFQNEEFWIQSINLRYDLYAIRQKMKRYFYRWTKSWYCLQYLESNSV